MTWKDGVSPTHGLVRGLGLRTAATWFARTMRQGTGRARVCLNTEMVTRDRGRCILVALISQSLFPDENPDK